MAGGAAAFLSAENWPAPASGPLYLQVKRRLEEAVASGIVAPGDALPSEREIASLAGISRVTVRRAVQELVKEGVLLQRQGSGTFVAPKVERVEQSLSHLTSFSEDMARRGKTTSAQWLERGVFEPSPEETVVLGLSPGDRVARLSRLRVADGVPLAIERAVLATAMLPDPEGVENSLYEALDKVGNRPVRAIQRISAQTLGEEAARLLDAPVGAAALRIERISYLASGRVVEHTTSTYRGDAYDFVAELRLRQPR